MAEQQLANWIREQMKARGWDQAELARRSGITSAQVSRVLSESRGAGLDFYRGLARAFGEPDKPLPLEAVLRGAGVIPPLLSDEAVQPLFERLSLLPEQWRQFVLTAWDGALLAAERAPVAPPLTPHDNHAEYSASTL